MVVPVVNRVCGCMDLRTGALFIATTQMVIGIISMVPFRYSYLTIASGLVVAIAGLFLLRAVFTQNRPAMSHFPDPMTVWLIITIVGIIIVAITGGWISYRVVNDAVSDDSKLQHTRKKHTTMENLGIGIGIVVIILYFAWMIVLIYFWICGWNWKRANPNE